MFRYLSESSCTRSGLDFADGRPMRDIFSIIFSSKLRSENSMDNRLYVYFCVSLMPAAIINSLPLAKIN